MFAYSPGNEFPCRSPSGDVPSASSPRDASSKWKFSEKARSPSGDAPRASSPRSRTKDEKTDRTDISYAQVCIVLGAPANWTLSGDAQRGSPRDSSSKWTFSEKARSPSGDSPRAKGPRKEDEEPSTEPDGRSLGELWLGEETMGLPV
eukprot:g953.t1